MGSKSSNSSQRVMTAVSLLILFLILSVGNQRLWSQENGQKKILAQKLVDQVAAKHRAEVSYVGLYSISPNGMNMAIVAATDPTTIGKQSDLQVQSVPGGHTLLDLKDGSIVIFQKLRDRSGQTVGVVVLNSKFADGQETEAGKLGKTIVDKELAQDIPSKAALFEAVP